MKHCTLLFAGLLLLAAGCHSRAKKPAGEPATEKKNYFPVGDFLESEMRYVDSIPLALIKYTTQGQRTDSVFITPAAFRQLARVFESEAFSNGSFERDFTETSFMDETTQSVVFTYATRSQDQELRRVDVLAKPVEGTDQVKSIYLEKQLRRGDTSITEKMSWFPRRSFQVMSSIQTPGSPPLTQQLRVRWGEE